MELILQENSLEFMERVLCESVTQEQTAELIVPDSIADCDRVADAFGTVLVRSAESSDGAAAVIGSVLCGIVFVTENGSVERLETQIPFTVRRELPQQEGREAAKVVCRCHVCSADARMLNSRKLLLRVGIVCNLTAYVKKSRICHALEEPSEQLQLRRRELPLILPQELGEKRFPINEELELPSAKPALARLLRCLPRLTVTEQKLVGDKAVFKGEITAHVLYAAEDDSLHSHDWHIPFSQYAETDSELPEGSLQTTLLFNSFEVEPDSQFECRRLFLSANLIALCMVSAARTIAVIDDAFCTDAELKPQYEQWTLLSRLDLQSFHETAQTNAPTPARSVLDAWAYPEEPAKQRDGARLTVELPLNCNVLYYDADGALQGKTLRPTVSLSSELSEQAGCTVTDLDYGEIFCSASSAGIDLRLPLTATAEFYAEQNLRSLSGGEIMPLEESGHGKPSVILRRTDSEEEVWEIAKSLRTPVRAIAEANAIEGTTVPANTMLLIPM